jgi:hypothetical protein
VKPPRPSAIVTLAGRKLTAPEAGLYWLRLTLGRDSHDRVEMGFWPRTKFSSASAGDEISVQLGFQDSEEDVWSGKVASVEQRSGALVIAGDAPTAALSREFKAQTYVGQQVGDIVRDLASAVDIDDVQGDASFSYYAVDHRRSVWGHLLDLALLTGSEITCSTSGGLRFAPIAASPSTTKFRYGAELLSWSVGPLAVRDAPVFAAHGSASESGSDNWHWVNPDPTSGQGGAQVIGAFYSRDLADSLSNAASSRLQRSAVQGEISLVGQPTLRAGDVFSLDGLASDPGPLRALTVKHSLDGVHGFHTTVRVEGAGA